MNKLVLVITVILILGLGGFLIFNYMSKDHFKDVTETLSHFEQQEDLNIATFAGGCFWCMEGPFEQLDGVETVITGYTGGDLANPTSDEVYLGETGHREAAKIFYNPAEVTYTELLNIFWSQIDPTDAGGQFSDRGDQYKTAIYYHTNDQKEVAEIAIAELNVSGNYDGPIATEILPAKDFYPAEDYHQDFYKNSAEIYKRYSKLSGRADYVEKVKELYYENN